MIQLTLKLKLKSAATFGRGDGLIGVVDREVEQDSHGFPYLRGKTLKGLLGEAAENVVYALSTLQGQTQWPAVKHELFGLPGRGLKEQGLMTVGDAELPLQFRLMMRQAYEDERGPLTPHSVFAALTGIRRQTAVNPQGAPDSHTLRSMRVLVSGLVLSAPLTFDMDELDDRHKALLAATVLDFRRAGTGRNRGRGWLKAEIEEPTTMKQWFNLLSKEIPA